MEFSTHFRDLKPVVKCVESPITLQKCLKPAQIFELRAFFLLVSNAILQENWNPIENCDSAPNFSL